MGVARLKRKTELNYRRGTTSRYCDHCNHLVKLLYGVDDDDVWRCEMIGVNLGRLYRINPRNICDAFESSLKG